MKVSSSVFAIIILIIFIPTSGYLYYLFRAKATDSALKVIEKVDSKFGPVWVYEQGDKRCISFIEPPTPIEQSCSYINNPKILLHNYAKVLLSTVFIIDNPQRILVIGLGGASVQNALNIILPRTKIDSVEINPVIKSLAAKYFNYKENALNHIFVEDAAEFAKKSAEGVYDIILLDVFSADYIPPHLLTDEFMQNVKKMLKKNGVVAINTFAGSKFSELESRLFKDNFTDYYNLTAGSSRIMIASKNYLPNLAEISGQSLLWRFNFVEIGINQNQILNLFISP